MSEHPPPTRRPNATERRFVLLDKMADHLLANGFGASALRTLGAVADTSDRMLLYYFPDRRALIAALLDHIANRLHGLLASDPGGRRPWKTLLNELWRQAHTPLLRPYMLLFFELAAAAGRHEEPHRAAAARIAGGFIDWTAARLDPGEGPIAPRAALLLATLDGLLLLDASGRRAEAEAALAAI